MIILVAFQVFLLTVAVEAFADDDESLATATAIVRVAHLHSLKRLAARLGGQLVVDTPAEARRVIAEWAEAGLARYT